MRGGKREDASWEGRRQSRDNAARVARVENATQLPAARRRGAIAPTDRNSPSDRPRSRVTRSRPFARLAAPLLAATLLAATLLAAPGLHAQDSTAVAAAQQLDIGEQWFRASCVECHAVGSLANADFRLKWNGKNAFELYESIRRTMPEEAPGSLTGPTYVSVIAYLIKQNGMPVGTALPVDSAGLAAVRLTFPAATSTTKR